MENLAPPPDAAFQASMRSMLHARRIAIVGASPSANWGGATMQLLSAGGYDGEVLPVNPRYSEVRGRTAYPSIDAIPGHIDLVVIATRITTVSEILAQCERSSVGAINIFTSGYAELPGDASAAERQRELREFADRTGIRIVGPNCVGNVSVPNRMIASPGYLDVLPAPGPISGVFQSGYLAAVFEIACHERGMGFTYIVSSGNEADLDAADFIHYFVDDDTTRVIACYVEQIRDGARFLAAAERAAEREKPIVILKSGRSEIGGRRTLAHTGALAGSDRVADAVFRQAGITRVDTMDEMVEAVAAFHTRRLPRGSGIGSYNLSGGAAVLMADAGAQLGLEYPEFTPTTTERLRAIIPAYGTIGNPIDATGQLVGDLPRVAAVFDALAEDPGVDLIVFSRALPMLMEQAPGRAEIPADLAERYPDIPVLIVSMVSGRTIDDPGYGEQFVQPVNRYDGVPFLHGVDEGMKAVRALVRYARFLRTRSRSAFSPERAEVIDQGRAIVSAAKGGVVVEREAKKLLALYGIPVTSERLAKTPDEAVAVVREIGYPVVLKIESADIAHKTEVGGVVLDVRSDVETRTAFARILANAQRLAPQARLDGVLVQEQLHAGRELILGMTNDPTFGPVVAVGFGGVYTETLQDVALGIPPVSADAARRMVESLRGYGLLEGRGARGSGSADVAAVVDAIERFARLCHDLGGEVAEIDVNPLIVFGRGQGVRAADALVITNS